MKNSLGILLVKRLIFIVIALCFIVNALATDVVINLPFFLQNPATNRTITWQAVSPVQGNIFTVYSDSSSNATLVGCPNTLINVNIKAPPANTFLQVQLLAADSGTVNITNRLASGSSSTFPAGQTAWTTITSDARYQLAGSVASNNFYPLNGNPSNYISSILLTNATNAIYAMLPQTNNFTSIVVSNPSAFVTPVSLIDATNRDYAAWLTAIQGTNTALTLAFQATNAIAHTDMTNLFNQAGVNATNLSVALTNLSYLVGQGSTNLVNLYSEALTNFGNTIGLADSNNVITASNAITVAYRATNSIAHTDMTNLATANTNFSYTIGAVATNLFNTASVNMTNLSVALSNTIAGVATGNGISTLNGKGTNTTLISPSITNASTVNTTNISILQNGNVSGLIQFPNGDVIGEFSTGLGSGNDTGISLGISNGIPIYERYSFLAGGFNDIQGISGSSLILGSSILGGVNNLVNFGSIIPSYTTVAGGYGNQNGSSFSFIAGGSNNISLNAPFSFVGGANAKAAHYGSWVWNAYTGASTPQFSSTATNQFLINANGGVGINTNNPNGYALFVNGSINATNIYVNGAAVLTSAAGVQNTNTVGKGAGIQVATNASGNSVVYVISADQQTNGFFIYSNFVFAVGLGNTNLSYLIGQANTNYSLTVGGGATNLANLYSSALTNYILLTGLNSSNLANLYSTALTNYNLLTGLGSTNLAYLIGTADTNNVLKVGQANTNLSYLIGEALTNYVSTASNAVLVSVTNAFVQSTNGIASTLTIKSNTIIWPFPWLTYTTNVIGINNAGVINANGTYIFNTAQSTWTNIANNGSDIIFQNPTYFLRTNGVNLYSIGNLFNNGTWVNVIGTTSVPTNSGFGFIDNHNGRQDTNILASSLSGLVPMSSIDTAQIITNNRTGGFTVANGGIAISGGGTITAVAGGLIGGVSLSATNVTAASFTGGVFSGNGGNLTNLNVNVTNINVITIGEPNASVGANFQMTNAITPFIRTNLYSTVQPFVTFDYLSLLTTVSNTFLATLGQEGSSPSLIGRFTLWSYTPTNNNISSYMLNCGRFIGAMTTWTNNSDANGDPRALILKGEGNIINPKYGGAFLIETRAHIGSPGTHGTFNNSYLVETNGLIAMGNLTDNVDLNDDEIVPYMNGWVNFFGDGSLWVSSGQPSQYAPIAIASQTLITNINIRAGAIENDGFNLYYSSDALARYALLKGTTPNNGSALTNLNASSLASGTIADTLLSANIPWLNGTNTFTGTNIFNKQMIGNGSGITNLNASSLISGTVGDARLSANVPLLNAANSFTANQTITNAGVATILTSNSIQTTYTIYNTNIATLPTVAVTPGAGTSATAIIITNNGHYSDSIFTVQLITGTASTVAQTNLFTVTYGTPVPSGYFSYILFANTSISNNSGSSTLGECHVNPDSVNANGFSFASGVGALLINTTNSWTFYRILSK